MDTLIQENENLRQKVRDIDTQVRELYVERRNAQNKIAQNLGLLHGLCSHKWEVMPPQYQEHTTWHCNVCGNYK